MSVISFTDYRPMPRYDNEAWSAVRVEGVVEKTDEWQAIQSFPLEPRDDNPAEPMVRNFTVEIEDELLNWARIVFIDDNGAQDATAPVYIKPLTAVFATVRDVEIRLGRDLNERQTAQADQLLTVATTNILNAIEKDATWEPPPKVKPLLSMLCVELACRAMANPQALGQVSESLGAYSNTITYPREIPGSGIMLTEVEELMIRRAVYGQNAATTHPTTDINSYNAFKGRVILGSVGYVGDAA